MVTRADGLKISDVDGTVVVESEDGSKTFAMDPVGGYMWQCLEEPLAIRDICDRLCEAYTVDREECEQETLAFVAELVDTDLLTIVGSA